MSAEPTRADLEEKLQNLSKSAQRYYERDPRRLELHRQIDDTLDHWEMLVALES